MIWWCGNESCFEKLARIFVPPVVKMADLIEAGVFNTRKAPDNSWALYPLPRRRPPDELVDEEEVADQYPGMYGDPC